ncbi:type 1 glutamine amidotransferase domain-containing protein [Rhizobium leguminosarum]|uniref:type 1 glutamine amidotransferase domain-containing protein n=1 Tax=Rhizobium leguminosarum TaxID=384 RepID=UPI0013DBCD93|nr:type 1 glutamine amidotransferase domain-containing protein [Rhizobium leguminosarum]MBY5313516.1 type 1 glutamine amidotransferase domain-containing protein [Rhizobium leguminosarum]NEH47194.1 type 1 glutamine amidotransferase domain-containing protein [Rhizobium leguminosarum]
MSKGKVLVVGSNATRIEIQGGDTGPTGQYLNETVIPAMALVDAGYAIVLATPNGTKPHIDPVSDVAQHFDDNDAAYRHGRAFFDDYPAMNDVRTLRSVLVGGLDSYAGVFVPGGQAPVVDLMQDADLGEILRHFHSRQKPTALLCHGPIASLAALPRAKEYRAALIAGDVSKSSELSKGWQYAGYKMTVFSGSEEKPIEEQVLHGKLYFTMPDALGMAGGEVTTNPVDFSPHVIVDRELITGQNPRSDHPLAAKLVEALDRAIVSA